MTATALPQRFPIFPLPNVVLFPDTRLPLHMFEPRYRALAEAAVAGEGVIGMVLLRPGAEAAEPRAEIFEVGCAGRIVESQRLPDGRFNLLLAGERRFRVLSESDEGSYRVARVELLPDPAFTTLDEDTRLALEQLRPELEGHVLDLAGRAAPNAVERLRVRMRELDPIALVHALAFGLDCGFVEKQSLLEAPDPGARAALLRRLLEFHKAEASLPDAPKMVN